MDTDEQEQNRSRAIELADSISGSVLAVIAKSKRVPQHDGSTRFMTVLELKQQLPGFVRSLFEESRRKAGFKVAEFDRKDAALREENARLRARVAELERLVLPHRIGDRTTPLEEVDPFDRLVSSLPEGVIRDSKQKT